MRLDRVAFVLVATTWIGCGGSNGSSTAAGTTPPPAAKPVPGNDASSCLAAARVAWTPKADAPETIRARHVLVLHAGSKNPRGATRTEGEACLRAVEARDKLRAGADFSEVVTAYSEEPGAASREGSIGDVKRTDLVKAFADAAFSLDPGELSDVVETEYGFHVILRDP